MPILKLLSGDYEQVDADRGDDTRPDNDDGTNHQTSQLDGVGQGQKAAADESSDEMHKSGEGGGVAHDPIFLVLAVGSDGEARVGMDGAHAQIRNPRRQPRRPSSLFLIARGIDVRTRVAQDRLPR